MEVAGGGRRADRASSRRAADRPDVILLDVMMPGLDGWRVAEAAHRRPATREIPIVFLTARAEFRDRARGLDIGGVDYVTKPFNPRRARAARARPARADRARRARRSSGARSSPTSSPHGGIAAESPSVSRRSSPWPRLTPGEVRRHDRRRRRSRGTFRRRCPVRPAEAPAQQVGAVRRAREPHPHDSRRRSVRSRRPRPGSRRSRGHARGSSRAGAGSSRGRRCPSGASPATSPGPPPRAGGRCGAGGPRAARGPGSSPGAVPPRREWDSPEPAPATAERAKNVLKTIEIFFAKRIKWGTVWRQPDNVKFLSVSNRS